MGVEGFIDWRGKPVQKERHGGRRAAGFIHLIAVMSSLAFVPTTMDMVGYLRSTMHMDVAATSSTVTTFIGCTNLSALLGGFLSDSYMNRFETILIFGPLQFLGYFLLALQAHMPSLQPAKCVVDDDGDGCEDVGGYKALLLYAGMCTVALGEGCLRANLPAFGADQFDDEDPGELDQKSSFFNWYGFSMLLGPLLGYTLTVWVANNVGWDYGFALSAGAIFLGLLALASGFSFYRYHRPMGTTSPLSRMLQVFVAAFTNRNLVLSENEEELLQELIINKEHEGEVLPHTKGFEWLDKASICCITQRINERGSSRWWSSPCSVSQVEETKILLRMLPIFVCAVFCYASVPQLMTFTVQQGSAMDTRVGPISNIPTATLLLIPVILQMLLLAAYDRFFVPVARAISGYRSGITHLQRVAVGFATTALALLVAGAVEWKRKRSTRPVSVLWLGAQFLGLGAVDAFIFVGLLEFFNSEVSKGMKSLGTAVFWCIVGLASLLGSVLVQAVNRVTGWLKGNDLNQNYLDRYYWLLSFIGMAGFLTHLFLAKRYVYRNQTSSRNCSGASSSMGVEGFVDWRGKPVDKARHGGHRAASFMYFMQAMTSVANVPNLLALVTYLHSVMHMAIDTTSTTMTNFFGATCAFALLGGFLSDSYITRFKTILIFGPLEILGYGLLALQARLPSLRPQPCVTGKPNCTPVQGLDSVLLYASLYTIALGEGGLRANLASFGGDQYDDEDPVESRQKSSFFNWFTFSLSIGAFLGLILIVWVEDNTGWPAGFALSAFFILVGLSVVVCGFPLYRNQCPGGSPLTRMLQVFVAAFKKRKLPPPEDETELHHDQVKVDKLGGEILPHTNSFRFLDKAAICHGNYTDSWSLCTVTQVEETKIVLRMVPIFISTCFNYIPIPLLLTLTVQQGGTMNTNLGNLRISPATLLIIPVTFQTVILVAYDRVFLPLARKLTGYKTGITHLQRIGIGFVASFIATSVAGAIERKRKSVAEEKGLVESSAGLPMSMFWLGLQFFFLGIIDASTFVGLLEFFNTEFSRGMKSLATAVFWCILGLSSFMGSVVVNVANDATKGHERGGWLEGNNLNRDHLDRFYWLLSVIGFLGFLNYLYWAKRYVYRQNLLIEDSG